MPAPLHLFQAFGIEIEYMIVDRASLAVRPVADELLRMFNNGARTDEIARERTVWSNELVTHVIELKSNGPSAEPSQLIAAFEDDVRHLDEALESMGASLLGSGMHPFMNPHTETRLWPYGNDAIYRAYDRIFGCHGHGWSNLQSMHLNLPFADDDEFGRLHAAVRLVLPLIPAISASSPICEGAVTGLLDTRLDVYRGNQRRIPEITGKIVPERIFSTAAYHRDILEPMYRAIAPYDPDGILQEEWLNSRGAIARFDRDAIEIRVTDAQECPAADCAIAMFVADCLRELCLERWCAVADQKTFDEHMLSGLLLDVVTEGGAARIADPAYASCFGCEHRPGITVADILRSLYSAMHEKSPFSRIWKEPLRVILEQGTLAERILRSLSGDFRPESIRSVYACLLTCMVQGRQFTGVTS